MFNSITGIDNNLLTHLENSIRNSLSIRMIIAFLMESGARLIADQLTEAARRGVRIRILTGTYMSVTEPSAIYYLWDKLGDKVEIRFFNEPLRSFHPKAYLFEGRNDSEIYVGSSYHALPSGDLVNPNGSILVFGVGQFLSGVIGQLYPDGDSLSLCDFLIEI